MGDRKRIWGRQWKYIVRGSEFRILRKPFDIEDVQVSSDNYGQGVIRFAYVHPDDETEILGLRMLV